MTLQPFQEDMWWRYVPIWYLALSFLLLHYAHGATNMVLIPSGTFAMGENPSAIGWACEEPTHDVFVSDFQIERTEVTLAVWNDVCAWATNHGYQFNGWHAGNSPNSPVQTVSWHDCLKWCNARSEKEGFEPVYYVDWAKTVVFRTGQNDLNVGLVKWSANGYRLPTEAEWEKSARGGLNQNQYPWPSAGSQWSNLVNAAQANYAGSGDPFEGDPCGTTPIAYYDGHQVITNSSGIITNVQDMRNGYGLYDIAGNVSEWVWDTYQDNWYSTIESTDPNPRGPYSGSVGILRGGSWIWPTWTLRNAFRYSWPKQNANNSVGFRCAQNVGCRIEGYALTNSGLLLNMRVGPLGTVATLVKSANLGNTNGWNPIEWFRPSTTSLVVTTVSNPPSPSFFRLRHQPRTVKLTVQGIERLAFVYPPTNSNSAVPVIFVFHGYGGAASDGRDPEDGFRFASLWPQALVVYPNGIPIEAPSDPNVQLPGWQFLPNTYSNRDVLFIDALMDWAQSNYQIDTNHMFATGFSNGGIFTYVLLNLRAGRFAGFAPVACVNGGICEAVTPKPVMYVFGKNDEAFLLGWAYSTLNCLLALNKCDPGSHSTWAAGYELYTPSPGGAVTIWHLHEGNHYWPTDVSRRVVQFFQSLP